MAKKTSKSKKLSSSSSTSASPASSNTIEKIRTSDRLRQKRPNLAIKAKTKPNRTNLKIDVKIPKKPATAFFFFLEDFRKEYQEQNPDVKSMRDIGKACGEKWKMMTYEEKVKYYDIATEKRAEFDQAMADYIKKKESAEYEETDDDSDFA